MTVDWRTVDSTASYKPHENNMYVPGNAAARSGDYARANGTLFFGVGVRRQTIRVNVLGDGTHDGEVHEKFALVLSNPAFPSGATSVVVSSQGGSTLTVGEPTLVDGMTTAYVEIADADPPPSPQPTPAPSPFPTPVPSPVPSPGPTPVPSGPPSPLPTVSPAPTSPPSQAPTSSPTGSPAPTVSAEPTSLPTPPPTSAPTPLPTVSHQPTSAPTAPAVDLVYADVGADADTVDATVSAPTDAPTSPPSPSPTPFPSSLPRPRLSLLQRRNRLGRDGRGLRWVRLPAVRAVPACLVNSDCETGFCT